MYKSIEAIQNEFRRRDLNCRTDQIEGTWYLRVGINGKSTNYEFLFMKDDDEGNDVSVRIFSIAKFPEDRWDKALEVINNIQLDYRYIRLTLDGKGEVDAQFDFPVYYTNIGEGAFEILIRFVNILDEIYADLMRALWG